jgi:hypothetical protein
MAWKTRVELASSASMTIFRLGRGSGDEHGTKVKSELPTETPVV